MRIRSIKPQIVEDEKVAPLSDIAFRLFACMIALADDHGNVKADARWLRSQIWWAHDNAPSIPTVAVAIGELSLLIETYEASSTVFAHLRGWAKHQRISNAGRPLVPLPPSAESKSQGPGHYDLDDLADQPDSEDLGESASRGESRRTSANRGSDKEKEKEKEKEKAGARAPHSLSISKSWVPDDKTRHRAMDLGLDVDREAERFRLHYESTGAKRRDWNSAFEKWLVQAGDFSKSPASPMASGSDPRSIPDL